jgi:methionyl-tRNA synthetase
VRPGAPTIIIGPPPTPNGDLHIGHLAGPYLSADIYARYLRACGRPVIYATGTDDSQTYVVATARKLGVTPEELCVKCWHDIKRTLDVAGIAVDGFAPPAFDDRYRAITMEFVRALEAAGKLRLRTVRLPYSERHGEYLMEGLVSGTCPLCLSDSRGGLCETCGHPNNCDELLDARSVVDPADPLTRREASILVLPLEEYRPQLTAYYEDRAGRWRPHISQLMRELLARPLPDFPITYPYHWGIPAPFARTPGQVLNAWVEGMPASMFCTAYAAEHLGYPRRATDDLWRAEHGARVVYFLGFDNAYFWGVTHLALLLAHDGRYVLPDTIVCNEFYELENEKFSTSKGHVVWAHDLLGRVSRDLVRFYLALTCPEHQRTNFSAAALTKVAGERLVEPWNRMSRALAEAVADLGIDGSVLRVPPSALGRSQAMIDRFRTCYELSTYSLTRAADAVVSQVARLVGLAQTLPRNRQRGRVEIAAIYQELITLVACSAPILIDLAAEVRERSGHDLALSGLARTEIRVFPLPPLALTPLRQSVAEAV